MENRAQNTQRSCTLQNTVVYICQLNKGETMTTPGLLQSLSIPKGPWAVISMDFICGVSKSWGKDALLVIIDKYRNLISLTHPFKASDIS
jgi:hypothetical protein